MKVDLIFWVLLAVTGLVGATPNGSLRVTEKVFGSNKQGYTILRSEYFNPGSYYNWTERSYLDEFKKSENGRELVSSTLLVEANFSFPDADTRKAFERDLVAHDETLKMGELLIKFPLVASSPWGDEGSKSLGYVPKVGIRFKNLLTLIGLPQLKKTFGDFNDDDLSLDAVLPAPGGGLFLEISTGKVIESDEASSAVRQFFIPAEVEKQIRDLGAREEVYLMFAEFKALPEAQEFAVKLRQSALAKENYAIHPEVWFRQDANDPTYRVVTGNSGRAIQDESYRKWSVNLKIEVSPVSGSSLTKRFLVPEPQ